ncbi:hypothetical protein [Confluentibacter flavum]|uniref:hypothetical protein n=1 Tax=Confluentibacter flavum TaxID=1909700 RepID=UPI0012FF54E0
MGRWYINSSCFQQKGNSRKAWKGRALVVVKSNYEAGEIKLSVTSPTLEESAINIKMVK